MNHVRKWVATLLAVLMMINLLPIPGALAASPDETTSAPEQIEDATVDVTYGSSERETATITYHKKGIGAPEYNIVFLVDSSVQGNNVYDAIVQMLRDYGINYLADPRNSDELTSNVQFIFYQNVIMRDSGSLRNRQDVYNALINSFHAGQGTANEPVALDKAHKAVSAISQNNEKPTVLVWALGREFGSADTEAIESGLQKVKDALDEEDGDALITWQLGKDTPTELLSKYATRYIPAHETEHVAATIANSDSTVFRNEIADSLEQTVHDHYHNVDFTLSLAQDQTLVSAITDVSYDTASPYANLTATVAEDGKSIKVHIEQMCRQSDIDFIVEVQCNKEVYTQETVIYAFQITDGHADGPGGGLYTGTFDDQIDRGHILNMPAVILDRREYTIRFEGGGYGDAPKEIKAMAGRRVVIPAGDDLSNPGSSFGGWNVTDGDVNLNQHYNAGEVIVMPAGNMTLSPAFGHVELELELNDVTGPTTTNNQMSARAKVNDLLNFNGVEVDGGDTIDDNSIVALHVIDQNVTYDKLEDQKDPARVKLTNVSNAVYARHVGEGIDDKVVAYLVDSTTNPGKYEMYIAGPGGVKAPSDMSYWMSGYDYGGDTSIWYFSYNVKTMDLSALDTSQVTDMSYMFTSCNNLTSLNITDWDTSRVKNMTYMFSSTALTSLNLNDWNTSQVTDMSYMFAGDYRLVTLSINKWNVSNVTTMAFMFSSCGMYSLNLNNWDTSKVTDMSSMFVSTKMTNLTLGASFNTSNVTSMKRMFYYANIRTLNAISGWNTDNVENMEEMFAHSAIMQLDLHQWKTPKLKNINRMFSYAQSLTNVNMSGWDITGVGSTAALFEWCERLITVNLDGWDTCNITNMSSMFYQCKRLNSLTLGNQFKNTSNVTDMSEMFESCELLVNLEVSDWDTSSLRYMNDMFNGCEAWSPGSGKLDLSRWNTSGVMSMAGLFAGCAKITEMDLSTWDTSQVTSMNTMFSGCTKVVTIDLGSKFDVGHVENMGRMFSNCQALENIKGSINLAEVNAVVSMQGMFEYCYKLTKCPIVTPPTGAQFPALNNTDSMFLWCRAMAEVDLGGWKLPNLTDTSKMFMGCSALLQVNLNWSGIRANTPGGFDVLSMFSRVPETATLEIGDDTDSAFAMGLIAQAFPGQVTVNGSPWPGGINSIVQPDTSEKPGATDTPEQPSEETGASDTPEQPSEETGASDTPEQPSDEPGATDTPEQPSDEPGATDTPEQPSDEPDTSDTPEQPSEEPDTSDIPEQPSEEPDTSDIPEQPSDDAGAPDTSEPDSGDDQTVAISRASVGAGLLSTSDAATQSGGNENIVVHEQSTAPNSVFRYLVRVKYVGDAGAKSGQIQVRLPIPKDVYVLSDDELKYNGKDKLIEVSEVEYSENAATGYLGGRIVTQPHYDKDTGTLYATFEGLYAGNEYEIAIWCSNDETQKQDDDYMYWDGIAYGQDAAASAASNIYRLWYKEKSMTPPTESLYTMTYRFIGDVPPDAQLPAGGVYTQGEDVTAAGKPQTSYGYYEFDGWYPTGLTESQKIEPETLFTMPGNNVTLEGRWTLKEASAPKINVTYEYNTRNDQGHVPNGAPKIGIDIPASQSVLVGNTHTIVQILEDADHHSFGGWVPSLIIGSTTVSATSSSNEVYTFEHENKKYTIDVSSGALQTEQFREASKNVTVAFSGAWQPYTGTVRFDANGGSGYMEPMYNVAYDTKEKLRPNAFSAPAAGYSFSGWAAVPGGKVIRQDGDTAENLITTDGQVVTLYAVWRYDNYDVAYELENVTSSEKTETVARDSNYTTRLTSDEGYEMDTVTVSMNRVDVTDRVYNVETGAIRIDRATGDIIIRAVATEKGAGTEPDPEPMPNPEPTPTPNPEPNPTPNPKPDPGKPGKPDVADPDDTGVSDWLNTNNHILFLVGYPDLSFGPERNMTRAEVASMFSNLLIDKEVDITTSFSDVPEDVWYAGAVNKLASLGMILGYEDGTFRPDKSITRAEFTAIAMRFTKGELDGDNIFSDIHEGAWYYSTIVGSIQYGWITGYEDGTFRPDNTITRAEVTTITNRMLGREGDADYIDANLDKLHRFPDVPSSYWAYYNIMEATNAHNFTKNNGEETWSGLTD